MTRSRYRIWWILVPIGILAIAVVGLFPWVGLARAGIHHDPQAIPSAAAVNPSPEWLGAVEAARSLIRTELAEQQVPGLSVAVGAGGSIVWAEGFGWAEVDTRVPVTPDTRFRIGTASTVLTSAAVGVLLDSGRLTLDDEIQTHVPEYPNKQWPVTLRQLMAHVGGLGGGDETQLLRVRCGGPEEALPYFADDPLLFEPGTQYCPSSYGWILVSAAVEDAAGQPFLTFLREQVFQPLGMDGTGAESAAEENPEGVGEPGEDPPPFTFIHRAVLQPLGIVRSKAKPETVPATIYSPGFGYDPRPLYGVHVMHPRNLSCYAGSMALFSTPSDLVRFGQALNGGALLKPATVESLLAPQELRSGQETGYGLGWDLGSVTLDGKATAAVGQDGELAGSKVASLMVLPESGIVVAVTLNSSDADPPGLARKVAEMFARLSR